MPDSFTFDRERNSDPDLLATIDILADRYENAKKSGRHLTIESLLNEVHEHDDRAAVLHELLMIEFEWCMKQGHQLRLDEYKARFSSFPSVPENAFRESVSRFTLGNYELFEQIAKGGMGIIYRARHVLFDKIVAVKVMPDSFLSDENALARFQREMKLIGNLDHPNIVRAFGAEKNGHSLILAMEYIAGRNLKQIVRAEGPIALPRALDVVRHVASALNHAHKQGIVHRDIKPENIMISTTSEIKVLDFGLGKFIDDSTLDQLSDSALTQIGSPLGTLDYLAPEQWETPGSVDIRADIYGLGCTLFFLLTGTAPYDTPNFSTKREKMVAHLTKPFPGLIEHGVSVPDCVAQLLVRMTAKERDLRHETPEVLLQDLDAIATWLENNSEYAEKLAKWRPPSKNRTRNIMFAVLMFTVMLGGVGFLRLYTPRNPKPDLKPPIVTQKEESKEDEKEKMARLRHEDFRKVRLLALENADAIEEQMRIDKIVSEQHPQREQLVDTLQLFADSVLYHCHVIGPKYEFFREEAEKRYQRGAKLTADPRKCCVLQCKLALLGFVSNDLDRAVTMSELIVSEYSRHASGSRDDGKTISVEFFLETLQGITDFYLAESPGEGRVSLRSVLDSFRLNTDSARRYQGECLDLQLLCIRLLLESSLADNDPVEAAADALYYLDPILLGTLAQEAEMRPFLRYYYDLAIRCCVPGDLGKPVEYIRDERMFPTKSFDSTHLVFYIAPQDSFLIFLPKDRTKAKRFELPYTRDCVREANRQNAQLSLPGEVIQLVESEWEAGRLVDLSWDDSIPYGEDALTDTDWPFNDQLDFERLRGIVK